MNTSPILERAFFYENSFELSLTRHGHFSTDSSLDPSHTFPLSAIGGLSSPKPYLLGTLSLPTPISAIRQFSFPLISPFSPWHACYCKNLSTSLLLSCYRALSLHFPEVSTHQDCYNEKDYIHHPEIIDR